MQDHCLALFLKRACMLFLTREVASTPPQVPDVLVNNAGANFMGIEPWFTEQGVGGIAQVGCMLLAYVTCMRWTMNLHVWHPMMCRCASTDWHLG